MRQFKPEKLFKPRDFALPELTGNCYLEIGAGRGLHAVQYAQANRDKQLIAIERTRVKFEDFAKRTAIKSLENLTAIHADAIPWVVYALPPQSLNGVFLLYPNPEPKNAAQRWLNMPFFEFLISRLKSETKIVLATNIKDYFEEAIEQTEQVWQLPYKAFEVDKDSKRTHFEIKYLARGETCYQLEITKSSDYQTRFDDWVFGKIYDDGQLKIFKKNEKYFLRYDAGAHQVVIREDEISREETALVMESLEGATKVLWALQERLIKQGIKPYISNVKT